LGEQIRDVRFYFVKEEGSLSTYFGRTVALLIGLMVSSTLVYFTLDAIKWEELVLALSYVKPIYLLAVACSIGVGIYLRAIRWRFIASYGHIESVKFFKATTYGVAVNMIVPGRLGEVVRIVSLARMLGTSLSNPLASALIDRSIDVIFLTVSVGVFALGFTRFQAADEGKEITVALLCILIMTVFALSMLRTQLAEKIAIHMCRRLLSKLHSSSEGILSDTLAFIRAFSVQRGFAGLFLSLIILGADCLALLCVLASINLELPWESSLVLWIVFTAGSSIPSAPGSIGVYQVAAIWGLGLFGVSPVLAVAAATIFQITAITTVLLATIPQLILDFYLTPTLDNPGASGENLPTHSADSHR